jgi:acyl carrier protein phosphodiesterase
MNHLAHALLSGSDADVLLGSLLGDFWRGAPDPAWPAGVRGGVLLHRRIDVFTDSHPDVASARSRFEPPWRRYAGILLDIYFDHCLARDWPRYASEPLADFSARVLRLLQANRAWLPADLNRFAGYAQAHRLFGAYAERTTIEQVLAGVGSRLRHANRLADAGPALWANAGTLDATFERFYPDLEAYACEQRARLA